MSSERVVVRYLLVSEKRTPRARRTESTPPRAGPSSRNNPPGPPANQKRSGPHFIAVIRDGSNLLEEECRVLPTLELALTVRLANVLLVQADVRVESRDEALLHLSLKLGPRSWILRRDELGDLDAAANTGIRTRPTPVRRRAFAHRSFRPVLKSVRILSTTDALRW